MHPSLIKTNFEADLLLHRFQPSKTKATKFNVPFNSRSTYHKKKSKQ
uniref:Uncharacterized protein n=1 Tax=Arundo donax TaxID=35708 RepID=A0A0A8ZRV8_ARUDO